MEDIQIIVSQTQQLGSTFHGHRQFSETRNKGENCRLDGTLKLVQELLLTDSLKLDVFQANCIKNHRIFRPSTTLENKVSASRSVYLQRTMAIYKGI